MAWTAAEISSSPPTRTTWNGELLCLWMLNTTQDCLIPRLLCVGRQNPNTPPLHKSLETRLGSRGYSQPLSHTKPPPPKHTHQHTLTTVSVLQQRGTGGSPPFSSPRPHPLQPPALGLAPPALPGSQENTPPHTTLCLASHPTHVSPHLHQPSTDET